MQSTYTVFVFTVFTQLQIYEEDFKREKREKESLQQQLRSKNSGVSHKFACNHGLMVQNIMVMSTIHHSVYKTVESVSGDLGVI